MTAEAARAWIKDGPMKEFRRARRGAGRYAEFGQASVTGPDDVVRHALGEGWHIVDDHVGVKPFHCEAEHEGRTGVRHVGTGGEFPPPRVGGAAVGRRPQGARGHRRHRFARASDAGG